MGGDKKLEVDGQQSSWIENSMVTTFSRKEDGVLSSFGSSGFFIAFSSRCLMPSSLSLIAECVRSFLSP